MSSRSISTRILVISVAAALVAVTVFVVSLISGDSALLAGSGVLVVGLSGLGWWSYRLARSLHEEITSLTDMALSGDLADVATEPPSGELGLLALALGQRAAETETGLDRGRQYGAYLDAIPTPVMAVDKDFNIVHINKAGAAVGGQSSAQAVGTKCFELFRTEHCQTAECRIAQAMASGTVKTAETISHAQGGSLPIEYTATPLYGDTGAVIGGLEYVLGDWCFLAPRSTSQPRRDQIGLVI